MDFLIHALIAILIGLLLSTGSGCMPHPRDYEEIDREEERPIYSERRRNRTRSSGEYECESEVYKDQNGDRHLVRCLDTNEEWTEEDSIPPKKKPRAKR